MFATCADRKNLTIMETVEQWQLMQQVETSPAFFPLIQHAIRCLGKIIIMAPSGYVHIHSWFMDNMPGAAWLGHCSGVPLCLQLNRCIQGYTALILSQQTCPCLCIYCPLSHQLNLHWESNIYRRTNAQCKQDNYKCDRWKGGKVLQVCSPC
jgi:hypothetical protein